MLAIAGVCGFVRGLVVSRLESSLEVRGRGGVSVVSVIGGFWEIYTREHYIKLASSRFDQ